jgi:flagellum-specific peptidoglycan hydrolase FlgJ
MMQRMPTGLKPLFLAASILVSTVLLRGDIMPQQRYVNRYASLAVTEMYRSGVPASITLSQGLLESRYGLSALAAEGHNHFGIKCHNDWKGKTMAVDDDAKGECFRVYDADIESFRDHSDFLRYRDRYKFLFDFPVTDYKAWANGLKKAGYATDPAYPAKLIKLIEDYDLSRFDKAKPADFEPGGKYADLGAEAPSASVSDKDKPLDDRALFPKQTKPETKPANKETRAEKKARTKAEREARKAAKQHQKPAEAIPEALPESPNALEEAEVAQEKELREEFHFQMGRKIYKQNGVPFLYAMEGEDYRTIAEENNIIYKQLLRYNDLGAEERLLPGTVVYLQAKKNQTRKGLDKYIVERDGESLRDICQRFGVKQKSIQKLNGFAPSHSLREGDTILLRK